MSLEAITSGMRPFMARVLQDIGPRPACEQGERQLGELLKERWRVCCDEVELHAFSCHPRAFLGWIPWLVPCYLLVLLCYWLFPPAALVLSMAALAVIFLQAVRFQELVDPLFRRAEGHNVVGVLRPRGEVRRRVVVSAHLDSAYEFTLWLFFKQLSLPLMVLLPLAFAWMAAGSAAVSTAWVFEASDHGVFTIIGVLGACFYPVVGLFVFFTAWSPVPGALDNLSGIAVVDAIGQAMAPAAREQGPLLESTELLLLATSAEEAGLRGARRFARQHRERLTNTPTWVINLDSFGEEQHLAVLHREHWTGAHHDPRLVRLALSSAATEGLAMKRSALVLGGTDAAPFSLAGIPAVTLIGQDSSRLIPNYHTRHDTLEHISEAALKAAFDVVLSMLRSIDQGALDAPGSPPERPRISATPRDVLNP